MASKFWSAIHAHAIDHVMHCSTRHYEMNFYENPISIEYLNFGSYVIRDARGIALAQATRRLKLISHLIFCIM